MTAFPFAARVVALPRPIKRGIALIIDASLCALSIDLAFYLRTNHLPGVLGPLFQAALVSIVLALPIFTLFGLYRTIFRYAGSAATLVAARASAAYGIPFAFVYTVIGVQGVPRTLGLLQPILLFLLVAGSRAWGSAWLSREHHAGEGEKTRILIYGAGASGRQVASALQMSGQVRVVGFLDDDRTLWNATINGQSVFAPDDLDKLVDRFGVTDVLLAINEAPRARRNEIINHLKGSGLHIRTMPGVDQLARGTVSVTDLKDLDIEDLLGRAPIPPDAALLKQSITGKVVLVTGAGGSIGSEICRQILELAPATLLLVDAGEYNLYTVHQDLLGRLDDHDDVPPALVPLLANIRDRARIAEIVATWRPNLIYHAAAYKHVPLVEHNIIEGLANNVIGTLNVALAARDAAVPDFVLISTDKAVRPTNVMGATKRLAEQILQALNATGGPTRFSMVRFGNVLGSSGSVVPLFRKQIAAGGPVTITHPEITRYFMTIPEAAQLVIQAGAMAEGGDVFVLDMGEPILIADLARSMIELSGFRVRDEQSGIGDIAIEHVGLRPGEKLYEELLIGNNPTRSAHPRIMRASEPFVEWAELSGALDELSSLVDNRDGLGGRQLLLRLVPDYQPTSDPVDFVALQRSDASVCGPSAQVIDACDLFSNRAGLEDSDQLNTRV